MPLSERVYCVVIAFKMTEDFWSRWQHRQTWLASLYNHNEITTKTWNNHHSESTVGWNSDNYRIKETPSIQTGRRGTDAKQAGPPSMCGGQKFGRDISGTRSPSPTPGSKPKFPMPGR